MRVKHAKRTLVNQRKWCVANRKLCHAVFLFLPHIDPNIHKKQFCKSKAKVVFSMRFVEQWCCEKQSCFSDVFLPLPPSQCADDSSFSIHRLAPCSPSPGLELLCPPPSVPLLSYSTAQLLVERAVYAGYSYIRVWLCPRTSWAADAFVLDPQSRKPQLLLNIAEGYRENRETWDSTSHISLIHCQGKCTAALLSVHKNEPFAAQRLLHYIAPALHEPDTFPCSAWPQNVLPWRKPLHSERTYTLGAERQTIFWACAHTVCLSSSRSLFARAMCLGTAEAEKRWHRQHNGYSTHVLVFSNGSGLVNLLSAGILDAPT